MLETLKDAMKKALPETRAYDGCISVDTYIEESTNTIHLIEDWETLDHQAKYLNWRVETGLLTQLDPILDGGAASIKINICGQKHNDI
jgi:quinol monooxygenase YgiN